MMSIYQSLYIKKIRICSNFRISIYAQKLIVTLLPLVTYFWDAKSSLDAYAYHKVP